MPTVRHPQDREDVAGHLPARVTVNGDSYVVKDGRVTPTRSPPSRVPLRQSTHSVSAPTAWVKRRRWSSIVP